MSIISISIRASPLSSLNVKYFVALVTRQYDHHNTTYDDDNDDAGDNKYMMITIDAFCHIVAKESVAILALEQTLCPVASLEEFHNSIVNAMINMITITMKLIMMIKIRETISVGDEM